MVRHCKAGGQEPAAQLTLEGQMQAEQLAAFFSERQIDYIVSSSYERAVLSILPLTRKLDLTVHIDERLCERVLSTEGLADWQEKLRQSFTDLDLKLTGGESSREAMSRGVAIVKELVERPEENIVVVTHGNLLALILKYFDDRYGFEEWRNLTNPDVYELVIKSSEKRVSRIWN